VVVRKSHELAAPPSHGGSQDGERNGNRYSVAVRRRSEAGKYPTFRSREVLHTGVRDRAPPERGRVE
jgi:hypothetical protein